MRDHGGIRRTFLGAALLAALLAAGQAPAAGDDLTRFSDPAASLADLAQDLEASADTLAASRFASRVGAAVVVSRRDPTTRKALAERVRDKIARSAEILREVGWNLPADTPGLIVVEVQVPGAPSGSVRTGDGRAVLVREGDAPAAMKLPEPPSRADGPPLESDVAYAGHRARLWAHRGAGAAKSDWLAGAAARRVLAWGVARNDVPPWLSEGLVAWIVSRTADPGPAGHVCRAWCAPAPATVATLLDRKASPPPPSREFLGRLVAAALAGSKDAPRRVAEAAGAAGPPQTAFEKVFGRPFADAVAAANATPPSPTEGAACDATGGVPCPGCGGAAKFQVACAECSGSGGVTCPSCLGTDSCPNCDDGSVRFVGGRKAKCRLCTGGRTKCLACSGAMKTACRACTGSGRSERSCLACTGGRMPCPEGSGSAPEERPCPWCNDPKIAASCGDCGGAGYRGCKECFGTQRQLCGHCVGTGEVRMVYEDGTTASQSKCNKCGGKGFDRCGECASGKTPCTACSGKGRAERDVQDCLACRGAGTIAPPDPALLRARGAELSKEEGDAARKMLDGAVKSLLTCKRTSSGAFALRELRRGRTEDAGNLEEPTAFANAMALWTLATTGRGADDPELADAWADLRKKANAFVAGNEEQMGTQAASLTLRALVSGGEDPKGALVKGLVQRLVKAQHASGFWGSGLLEGKEDDALDTLFAAEGLRIARIKGARVPAAVWTKLLGAASSLLDSKTLSTRNEWLIGTEVASGVALIVMAKEGSLGSKATAFDYASLPQVKKGMAWLDRHFDIVREPQFSRGARRRGTSDAGYMAWLFSIQRLGMLLRTEELGGTRWYPEAVRHLRTIQYADGSFEERSRFALNGALRTTCGAILFLVRATPPITDGADEE